MHTCVIRNNVTPKEEVSGRVLMLWAAAHQVRMVPVCRY